MLKYNMLAEKVNIIKLYNTYINSFSNQKQIQ